MRVKTGVIDTGGGLRDVFGAGVFDWCMDNGVRFDYGIGISAGAANLISYVAGQRGRNLSFYTEYPKRKEYMSLGNFLFKRSYIDLAYVYGTLSNAGGENPLDFDAVKRSGIEWYIQACDAQTGQPKYFTEDDIAPDDYRILMASSAIPVVCKPVHIDGVPYFDGALGQTVPVDKALADGVDKLVLVLSKPSTERRDPARDEKLARRLQRKYPAAAEQLAARADKYNAGVERALELEAQGKVLVVAPDDTCGVGTLTKDAAPLKELYGKGYAAAPKIAEFLAS